MLDVSVLLIEQPVKILTYVTIFAILVSTLFIASTFLLMNTSLFNSNFFKMTIRDCFHTIILYEIEEK